MRCYIFSFFKFIRFSLLHFFFFFNDTATTEIYTLSLHDALPISASHAWAVGAAPSTDRTGTVPRSEEHTSELQSLRHLVCRLLLEKKKEKKIMLCHKNNKTTYIDQLIKHKNT